MNQENTNSGGLVIVAGIAILALVIGWFAFNRSGEDLTTTIGNEAEVAADATEQAANRAALQVQDATASAAAEAEQVAARAEVRAELLALEARIEADAAYEGAAEELEALRSDLAGTYENAEGQARSNWQQMETAFNQAVNNLQAGTADALEEVRALLLMLENDVRPNAGANGNAEVNLNR